MRVEGLTRLAAFSDDGPLNTAQPFMPFGARPKDGATFLVGAPELAAKPVTRVGVTLTWADLPRRAAGFEEHYRDYGEGFRTPELRRGIRGAIGAWGKRRAPRGGRGRRAARPRRHRSARAGAAGRRGAHAGGGGPRRRVGGPRIDFGGRLAQPP